MIHFATINVTGTSVNPARSIAANIFAGGEAIKQLWLFILAPLIGGALGGLTYPALFGRGAEPVAGSGFRFARRTPPGAVPGYGAPDAYQQQWNQQQYAATPPQAGQQWPPQPPHWQHPQAPHQPGQPQQQTWPPEGDDNGQTQVRPPT